MPSFKYYNIQLLPIGYEDKSEKSKDYIGAEGYKKIFSTMKSHTELAVEQKNLKTFAAKTMGTYFTSRTVEITDEYAYGKFIKFNDASDVYDNLSGTERYKAGAGDATKRYEFPFVFDFNKHILAIEDSKGIPSSSSLVPALTKLVDGVLLNLYSDYNIKVEELTLAGSLEAVLVNENTFNRVEVSVTFSNSEDWDDATLDMIAQLENELKDKQIDERKIIEKASGKSVMACPSNDATLMLGLASKYGNATISYNTEDEKNVVYRMADYPVKQQVSKKYTRREHPTRASLDKSFTDYIAEVWRTIPVADSLAKASKTLLEKMRGFDGRNKK